MAKVKSRPQAYSAMSFHLVRAIAFISQAIVSGILIFFCIQLRKDGFKLPWTFIIVLAASLLSIISILITTIFYVCSFLSPLFNLIVNVTVLIIQFVGFVLLSWNMSGTLSHSCSASNWASNDGMMVCRIYKAFYSFVIFTLLAQIAQIVLDARSRSAQTQLGRYGNIESNKDLKLDDLSKAKQQQYQSAGGHSAQPSHASSDDVPYSVHDYRDQPTRPTYQAYQPPASGESASYYGSGGGASNPQVRMNDFNNVFGSGQRPDGAAYGSGGYGYQGR
ncbi:uncharacterized protein A1O9_11352 [Exophiala aquamarina CBS 119918]|uniref:MARVEL domain-containing protein n=1 Tax=Exophiala aquamarina CBS 119918 TaxID=1182545 RepID=A0A072PA96_9EURO|nr:uncharacterized protein A1O9_11352 [Exophiala aquamarina CBS 119918]KEF52510.1 hypothetical protein A1O9_11352 [Exophiala aquamarina CBS 119918]